jgi:hypothetical protein
LFMVFAAVLAGLMEGANDAAACYVHKGQYQGLQVSHALSIPVSVSTRQAIVAGDLEDIPRATESNRQAALKQLTAIVGFFGKLSASGPMPSAPDFAVLLTESVLWTGFSVGTEGRWRVHQHLSGPADDDVVIVVSDPTMAALLKGRLSVELAAEKGLIDTAQGSALSQQLSLAAFGQFVDRFAASHYAGFRLKPELPRFQFANPLTSLAEVRTR